MGRYFGVPLEELVYRENCNVPSLVVSCATAICKQGIEVDGILHTNGSSKLLDKLRSSYNRTSAGDVRSADPVTVGGLLKVFLRELPDGLIPQQFTAQFVNAQNMYSQNPQECLRVMKQLLCQLPKPNYATLKFIIAFLVLVTHQEEVNKMNATALSVVFGSLLFRCASGIEGLKEQGVTNYITLTFITKYDVLFLESHETSPHLSDFILSEHVKKLRVSAGMMERNNEDDARRLSSEIDSVCSPSELSESTAGDVFFRTSSVHQFLLLKAIRQAVSHYVFNESTSSGSEDSDQDSSVHKQADTVDVETIANNSTSDEGSITATLLSTNNQKEPFVRPLTSQMRPSSPVTARHKHDTRHTLPVMNSESVMSSTVSSSTAPSVTPATSLGSPPRDVSVPAPPLPPRSYKNSVQQPVALQTRESSSEDSSSGNQSPVLPPRDMPVVSIERMNQPLEHEAERLTSVSRTLNDRVVNDETRSRVKTGSVLAEGTASTGDATSKRSDKLERNGVEIKRLNRQLQAVKKKVREFEVNFEKEHGHTPLMSDKAARLDVKQWMTEVADIHRQLADIRNGSEDEPPSLDNVNSITPPASMEGTLVFLLRKLVEKRREGNRPEELSRMTHDEMKQEKLAMQKALIYFEGLHGRPSTAKEKELMHPLYDRYRQIKQILSRYPSDDKLDDDPAAGPPTNIDTAVPLHDLSFVSSCTYNTTATVKSWQTQATTERSRAHSGSTSQDYKTDDQQMPASQVQQDPEVNFDDWMSNIDINAHHFTTSQLQSEIQKLQVIKKKLQVELHNFEQTFVKTAGRRMQRADRMSKEAEYRQYKAVKGRLKLIEALLKKRGVQSTSEANGS